MGGKSSLVNHHVRETTTETRLTTLALSRDTVAFWQDMFYGFFFHDYSLTKGYLTTVPVCCTPPWDSAPRVSDAWAS